MSGGEYRGKIIIEADGSQVQQATKQVNNMAAAFAGANSVFRGTSAVMRGNYEGFLELAVGARVLWTALGSINPVLKIATLALSAIGPVIGGVISYFRDSKPIESFTQKINRLGLAISDLDRHKQAIKNVAADFNRIKEAAEAAHGAIQKVADAQIALNRARGDLRMGELDLEEANKLAGATSDEERLRIQREYAVKRADQQAANVESQYNLKKSRSVEERSSIRDEWQQEDAERAMLAGNVQSAQAVVNDTVKNMLATIVSAEDFSDVPMKDQWRAKMSREKEIAAEFQADPQKALRKYSGRISDDKFESLNEQLKHVDTQRKVLSDFDAEAPARASERSGRYHAKVAEEEALAAERDAALLRVQTGKVNVLAGINAQAAAGGDAGQNTEAGRRAAEVEGRYRFDQADPARQLAYLDLLLKNMAGKELTPQQREDRVDYLRMRDAIQGRVDREKLDSKGQADEARALREEQLERARSGMSDWRKGSSFSIDTSQIFDAMYAGGTGNTDWGKQVLEDRAAQQVDLLKTIANNTKAESV